MITRPTRSGSSCTVRPSVATSSRPSAGCEGSGAGSDNGACSVADVTLGTARAEYSTHCSSSTALLMSASVTMRRSEV